MSDNNPFADAIQKAKNFLAHRQQAYRAAFNPESKAAETVLKDLAKFCRGNQTTFNADPRLHALLEGRREVWLRITNHLNLTAQQLWELTGRKDLES